MGNLLTCYCRTAEPNEVVIKTSACSGKTKYISGAATFVCGAIHEIEELDLTNFQVKLASKGVMTRTAVTVCVDANATCCINGDPDVIGTGLAARSFGHLSRDEIIEAIESTLEGSQRAILSEMSMEEINEDREKLRVTAKPVLQHDLGELGINILNYTIEKVYDENGYYDANGDRETCLKMASAEANKTLQETEEEINRIQQQTKAKIAQMEQDKQIKIEYFKQETEVRGADSDRAIARIRQEKEAALSELDRQAKVKMRDLQIKTVETQRDVDAQYKKIIREKQQEVEILKRDRDKIEAEWAVKIAEAERAVKLSAQEILRKEKEVQATIIEPARSQASAKLREANASAFKIVQDAEAEANRVKAEAEANAERIRVEGVAEAEVIEKQGFAKAEEMKKKAEAWKRYTAEALQQRLIQQLPQCAEAITAPLQNAEIVRIDGAAASNGLAMAVAECSGTIEILSALTDISADELKEAFIERHSEEADDVQAARDMAQIT